MGAISQALELAAEKAGRAAIAPAEALYRLGVPAVPALGGGAAITGGAVGGTAFAGAKAIDWLINGDKSKR